MCLAYRLWTCCCPKFLTEGQGWGVAVGSAKDCGPDCTSVLLKEPTWSSFKHSCFMLQALEPGLGLSGEPLGPIYFLCLQLCPSPGIDAPISPNISHKFAIHALLLYVTGGQQGPQPKEVWRSPDRGDVPLGASLPSEPGRHVPASTAAAATGQVPGCAAGSGSLFGLQQ